MKAIQFDKTGDPEVLELREIKKPEIKTGTDVLVKLKAAGVNPVDGKFRKGAYPISSFPTIPGCDGAGIVEAIGNKVSGLKQGDEVYFFHGGIGTGIGNYAEYIVLDERFIAHKSSSIDFNQAAALPLVFITAWESLHDRVRIQPGQKILIHAGAGGVGHIAIQIAKLAGAEVSTTVSSDAKADFVHKLGADHIINYQQQNFVDEIMEWTHGQGVDIVMDNVGGKIITDSFPAVKHFGDLVTLLQIPGDIDWTQARMRNLRFSFEIMLTPLLFNLIDAQKHQTWILEQCSHLVDENKLSIHVSDILTLDQAIQAHQMIEHGNTTGKIVLQI